jgi:hypothetical protein
MPSLSIKTKHYYGDRVRSVLVQNPQTSIEGINKRLEQQGLTLDRHYVSKLVGEIHTERTKRADTWMLNMALASFQDAMAEIARVGWEIANDKFVEGRAAGDFGSRPPLTGGFLFMLGKSQRKEAHKNMYVAFRSPFLSPANSQYFTAGEGAVCVR